MLLLVSVWVAVCLNWDVASILVVRNSNINFKQDTELCLLHSTRRWCITRKRLTLLLVEDCITVERKTFNSLSSDDLTIFVISAVESKSVVAGLVLKFGFIGLFVGDDDNGGDAYSGLIEDNGVVFVSEVVVVDCISSNSLPSSCETEKFEE